MEADLYDQTNREERMENVGDNLARLAGMHRITQAELGSLVGMSENGLTNLVRGHSKPSLSTMVVMAQFFGVSIEQLMGSATEAVQAGAASFEECESKIQRSVRMTA